MNYEIGHSRLNQRFFSCFKLFDFDGNVFPSDYDQEIALSRVLAFETAHPKCNCSV